MRNRFLGFSVALIAILVLVRCDKVGSKTSLNPSSTSFASGTFSDVYNRTIKGANCNECHHPKGAAWVDNGVMLDFTSQAKAFQGLTANRVQGKTSKGICPNVRIVAASAKDSYLAAVLFIDYNKNNFGGVAGCSPYTVHLQDQNLSAAEKTSIVTWINSGAKNN